MQFQSFFGKSKETIKRIMDKFKSELSLIRVGMANSAILKRIRVECYGSYVSIDQIAAISIPDAKTIEIRPWEISHLREIEKAILRADIGVNPMNNGKFIRILVSPLTEEKRIEVVKYMNGMAEKFRIAIRNERRVLIDNVKTLERNKVITEDDKKKFELEVQKITNDSIKEISKNVIAKESEIMQI
jgi:ribosome recycling factor